MDISRVFMSLRPNATFTDAVNFHSLDTVSKVYQGIMPTQAEMEIEWTRLQALDNDINYQKTLEADIDVKFDTLLKAFALVLLDEINLLRSKTGLPTVTKAQLKQAIKNKL